MSLVRVVDGDTIVVARPGDEEMHVRLLGIDCLETRRTERQRTQAAKLGLDAEAALALGEETTRFVEARLREQALYLEFEPKFKDRYRRKLAYVWVGTADKSKDELDSLLNHQLLETGRAVVYEGNAQPGKYDTQFRAALAGAQHAKIGIWDDSAPPPPTPVVTERPSRQTHERSQNSHPSSDFPWRWVVLLAGVALLLAGANGGRRSRSD